LGARPGQGVHVVDEDLEGRVLAQGCEEASAQERVIVENEDGRAARRNVVHRFSPPV
jgi:hypothetical protein